MEIIAHRGAHHNPQEQNTVLAFNRAVSLGCPMIELDVRCTRDGQLVVVHDPIFQFKGYQIRVGDQQLERLVENGLVADRLRGAGTELRIPTLRLVLDLFLHQIKINVELKDSGSGSALHAILEKMLRPGKPKLAPEKLRNLLVSSFLKKELMAFRAYGLGAEIETALLLHHLSPSPMARGRLTNWMYKSRVSAVHLPYEIASEEMVEYFKRKAIDARVYTLNDPEQMAHFESMGVQGVFTDKAQEFMRAKFLNRLTIASSF